MVRANKNKRAYKVLIADDHSVMRHGLRRILESQTDIDVCSEAATGVEAIEQAKSCKPDLVVLDVTMPEMSGLEAARVIHESLPETGILILSMHFSEGLAREAIRQGARGYILKSDADKELLRAIEKLREGESFFTSGLAASMAEMFGHPAPAGNAALPGVPLSDREIEIIRFIAEGRSSKQVASQLGVSTRTIEGHRTHIMHKMKFKNFSELVRFAVRNQLVKP
jgi:DNA-binding NarL/FixJ family response regulator